MRLTDEVEKRGVEMRQIDQTDRRGGEKGRGGRANGERLRLFKVTKLILF
jgi:hypothetical protein